MYLFKSRSVSTSDCSIISIMIITCFFLPGFYYSPLLYKFPTRRGKIPPWKSNIVPRRTKFVPLRTKLAPRRSNFVPPKLGFEPWRSKFVSSRSDVVPLRSNFHIQNPNFHFSEARPRTSGEQVSTFEVQCCTFADLFFSSIARLDTFSDQIFSKPLTGYGLT